MQTINIGRNIMGRVHSIDTFTSVDGPGIRYMLFLQGCLLRCKCCANPDTWNMRKGIEMSSKEIVADVLKYKGYIDGMTVSGGEPLLQPDFVASVFQQVKNHGLTTCIDTAGQGGHLASGKVLDHTDCVLMCFKHVDPDKYKTFTGVSQSHALRFIQDVGEREIPMYMRYLYIPGFSDDIADIDKFIDFSMRQKSLKGIEVLPYHRLGANKWRMLGLKYELEGVDVPSKHDAEWLRNYIRDKSGLKVF
jgi:pyruvate formate lyase activating enzyme